MNIEFVLFDVYKSSLWHYIGIEKIIMTKEDIMCIDCTEIKKDYGNLVIYIQCINES